MALNGRGGGRRHDDEDSGPYAKIPAKQRQRFVKAFFYIVVAILPPLAIAALQLERARSCFADPAATHVWDCITYLPLVENWIYVAAVAALGLFLLLPVLFWDG